MSASVQIFGDFQRSLLPISNLIPLWLGNGLYLIPFKFLRLAL